ncbi:ketopantoate reductase family protein [Brenneria populi subsp. brevivirga]|uniref:ketopantoate reductase family protein n=1 Tax=Brenneria populi TaxID=1505588 RepID=UPI002E19912E|nr:ketopantoate reductase family protein [Brenneria populi subsp. brevivirga]
MRVLVVGAGATGGFFGARLAQAGRDVTFLLREKRAAEVRKSGLQVMSPHGDFSFQPNVILAKDLTPTFDLILLTVKSYALAAALEDIAPAVGAGTAIMPILNGMRHLGVIRERFGAEAPIGALCRVDATLDENGYIRQLSAIQQIVYGEISGETTPRIQQIDALFQNIGVAAKLSGDIMRDMWEKWLFLSSLGAIACLMRGNIGQVAAAEGGKAFATALIHEVAATMKASGYVERKEMVDGIIHALTDENSRQTSSMYRDMMAGLPVEADQIIGHLVSLAASHRLHTPLLNAAYTRLAVYQQNRVNAG